MKFDLTINKRQYPEITNRDYLAIIKCIQNNDDIQLNKIFETLLSEDLTIIEKVYVLTYLRSVCIGPSLKFQNTQGAEVSYDINLCLEQLSQIDTNWSQQVDIDSVARFTLTYPKKLYFEHEGDAIIGCIEQFDGKNYDIADLIPPKFFPVIADFYTHLSRQCDIVIVDFKDMPGFKNLTCGITDNQFFQYIKFIYSCDLMNFYMMQHQFMKVFQDSDFFWNLTPAETQIHLNICEAEAQKQLEKSKQPIN